MNWTIRDIFEMQNQHPIEWELPSPAWIRGWEAAEEEVAINPYFEGEPEYDEWQEGYDAAVRNE